MTPGEFDRFYRRMSGAFPRMVPAVDDQRAAQREAWFIALRGHDFDRCMFSLAAYTAERRVPPAVSDIISGVRARVRDEHAQREQAQPRGDRVCPECDNTGWTFVSMARDAAVRRCSRRCRPPVGEQVQEEARRRCDAAAAEMARRATT